MVAHRSISQVGHKMLCSDTQKAPQAFITFDVLRGCVPNVQFPVPSSLTGLNLENEFCGFLLESRAVQLYVTFSFVKPMKRLHHKLSNYPSHTQI